MYVACNNTAPLCMKHWSVLLISLMWCVSHIPGWWDHVWEHKMHQTADSVSLQPRVGPQEPGLVVCIYSILSLQTCTCIYIDDIADWEFFWLMGGGVFLFQSIVCFISSVTGTASLSVCTDAGCCTEDVALRERCANSLSQTSPHLGHSICLYRYSHL